MTDTTTHHATRNVVLFVAILGMAVGAVWWATRAPRVAPSAAVSNQTAHGVMPGATPNDVPRSVELGTTDARRIGVTYAVATFAPVAREIRLVGEVSVDETRQSVVALKVDGFVERLWVDFTGRTVRRGEPMLALYSPMLVSAQEELLLALRLHERLAEQGVSPVGDTDAVRRAQSLAESARRRLRLWDVPDEAIQQLEATGEVQRTVTFAAPASGIVTEKNVVRGQQVMAGQPLLRLADLSNVWVEGAVFEQDLASVRVGQPVSAEFRSRPGASLPGRVSYVYSTLDPVTRTARVRAVLANPGGWLMPGMVATLRVVVPGLARTVSIPRSAVLTTGERSLVFVKGAAGKLQPHAVTLGASNDTRVEILSGLAAGDTIVASGTFLLDAESNLSTAMGGMGDMPGMDMGPPVAPGARAPAKPAPRAPKRPPMSMPMPDGR